MGIVRIVCINKDHSDHNDPHEAITDYGWQDLVNNSSGKSNRLAMVKYIEEENSAYVLDKYGNKAYCYVRTSKNGNKFLQTKSDSAYTNNLLQLKECVE